MKPPRRNCSICGKHTLFLRKTGVRSGTRYKCGKCYRKYMGVNPVMGMTSLLVGMAVGAMVLKNLEFMTTRRLTSYEKMLKGSNKFVALMNKSLWRMLK